MVNSCFDERSVGYCSRKKELAYLKTSHSNVTLPMVTSEQITLARCFAEAVLRTCAGMAGHPTCGGFIHFLHFFLKGYNNKRTSVDSECVIYSAPSTFVLVRACERPSSQAFCMKSRVFSFFEAISASDSVVFVSDGRCLRQLPERSRGGLFVSPLCQEKWQPFRLFSQKHIHLCENGGRWTHMKGPRVLRCAGRESVDGLQCKTPESRSARKTLPQEPHSYHFFAYNFTGTEVNPMHII